MWWVLVINQRKDIISCEENRRSKTKGASRIGCLILWGTRKLGGSRIKTYTICAQN